MFPFSDSAHTFHDLPAMICQTELRTAHTFHSRAMASSYKYSSVPERRGEVREFYLHASSVGIQLCDLHRLFVLAF